MRASALVRVRSLVAKPGIEYPSTFVRGSPRRSIARVVTMSAWVESRPPETPMTALRMPALAMRVASPWTWML
jgi:hypothetical protein